MPVCVARSSSNNGGSAFLQAQKRRGIKKYARQIVIAIFL